MGTHYNGSETSSYHTSGNDKKVIHTRSGTKIILNDAEGSVFIEDPSGNTYLMDGQGNINVNAPKNMTFTAGDDLNINVGKNFFWIESFLVAEYIFAMCPEKNGLKSHKYTGIEYPFFTKHKCYNRHNQIS